jgi:hypothetical protein
MLFIDEIDAIGRQRGRGGAMVGGWVIEALGFLGYVLQLMSHQVFVMPMTGKGIIAMGRQG